MLEICHFLKQIENFWYIAEIKTIKLAGRPPISNLLDSHWIGSSGGAFG
jgi:hypothetical protein